MHFSRISSFMFPVKFTILLLLTCTFLFGQKTVLVLSGGGARGLSHIGALKALDEQGIVPDIIYGASMGAIVGSFYASGFSGIEIETLLDTIDLDQLYNNNAKRKTIPVTEKEKFPKEVVRLRFQKGEIPLYNSRVLKGQTIYSQLSPYLLAANHCSFDSFDSLQIPFRVVCTDLVTGNTVVIDKGDLLEAIKASSAIPVAFTPVKRDSMLLVDGGIKANIPIIDSLITDEDFIIAVDATSPLSKEEELSNPVNMLLQVAGFNIEQSNEKNRKRANILIQPELNGNKNSNFDSTAQLIEAGYEAGKKALAQLKITRSDKPKRCDRPFIVDTVTVVGNSRTRTNYILNLVSLERGDTITQEKISDITNYLYGTDLFENVHLTLEGNRVVVHIAENPYITTDIGIRADEYHSIELFARPGYNNLFGTGTSLELLIQYGIKRQKYGVHLTGFTPASSRTSASFAASAYTSTEQVSSREEMKQSDSSSTTLINYTEFNLAKQSFHLSSGIDIYTLFHMALGLSAEQYSLSRSPGVTFSVNDNEQISSIFLSLLLDTYDSGEFPNRGGKVHWWFSGASSEAASQRDFFTFYGFQSAVIPLNRSRNLTLIPAAHMSWSDQTLPAVNKYYLGGARTVNVMNYTNVFRRIPFAGVQTNEIPGDQALILNTTLRLSVPEPNLHFSCYVDWGMSWDFSNDLTPRKAASDFIDNAPVGVELEAAWETILGPIRLSVAQIIAGSFDSSYNVSREPLLHFSAGYNF